MGITPEMDSAEALAIRNATFANFIAPFWSALWVIGSLFQNNTSQMLMGAFGFFAYIFCLYLISRQKSIEARIFSLLVTNASIFLGNDAAGFEAGVHFFYLSPLLMASFMFSARKKFLIVPLTLLPAALWVFALSKTTGLIMPPVETHPLYGHFSVFLSVIFVLIFFYYSRIQLEEAMLESDRQKREIAQSSRMAALGEMAAGIAHEVNNPLTLIVGRAEILKRILEKDDGNRETANQQAQKIVDTGYRIARIVKGLRTFSRNADHDPKVPVLVSKIFQDTLDLCGEKLRNGGVEIRNFINPQHFAICRSVQISQVLLNLINNSFDAVLQQRERWIEVSSLETDTSIQITVRDSGRGIPNGIADKMMQPFFTTKTVGKGTGLGLSISQGIIESHSGKLIYDSSSGHTSFTIQLPKTSASASETKFSDDPQMLTDL